MPFWLQVLALCVSFLALGVAVVTLPTAFQMWWGKPTLDVEFKTDRRESGVGLRCFITNDPVKGWRKELGVHRETANNLCVVANIREGGRGSLVGNMIRPTINVENGPLSLRVDLHAGLPGIAVIFTQETGQENAIINDKSKNISILPGEYECELKVVYDRGVIIKKTRCIIGRTADETYWVTGREQ